MKSNIEILSLQNRKEYKLFMKKKAKGKGILNDHKVIKN